jgi:streptogramin lyase
MRSKTALMMIVGLILLAALACRFGRQGSDEFPRPTVAPAVAAPAATAGPVATATATVLRTAAPSEVAPSEAAPPARERLGQVGLIYAPPTGYAVDYAWNRVELRPPDADPDLGALIEIDSNPFLCGERIPGDLNEAMEVALLCSAWWFDAGGVPEEDPVARVVSGTPALMAEMEGMRDGVAMRTRMVVLKPGPTRVLVISGRARADAFDVVADALEALLASVELLGWQTFTNGNDVEDLVFYDGYLWTATSGGVIAWPLGGGIPPIKYTVADGLPSNDVRALTVCMSGGEAALFAGMGHGGVARFEPGLWTWIDLNDPYAEWSDRDVRALGCALDNRLVVGYAQGGVDFLNLDEVNWYYFNREEGVPGDLRALAATRYSSHVWVIGEEGLALISDEGLTPVRDPDLGVYYQAGLDSVDNLWVAAFDRVIRRTPKGDWTTLDNRQIEGLFHARVTGLALADDDTVWLGSYNQLSRFDPVSGEVVEEYWLGDSPVPGAVGRLAVDPYYGWVAYTVPERGAAVLKDGEWGAFVLENEPPADNHLRTLTQDIDGYLWVGDRLGQLWVADPATIAAPLQRYWLPRGFALSIYPDPEGGIWVGHFDGASRYSLEGALHLSDILPQLADHYVRAMARDTAGRLWLGGDEGLLIWDGARLSELTEADGLPGMEIRALQPDGDAMWVGTTQGLARVEGARFDVFIPGELIGALALDQWGDLLVATGSSLLIREAGGAFEPFLESDWNSPLTSIAVGADGEIWVTTALDGVYTLQYHGEGGDWLHLSGKDGLPGNAYGAYGVVIDRDGVVWLGGTSGGLGRYGPRIP